MPHDAPLAAHCPLGQRFSRLSPHQQVTALREALAWQRQGLDWNAALALAVQQVERAPEVQRFRQQVQRAVSACASNGG
jgi:hypothetical protein